MSSQGAMRADDMERRVLGAVVLKNDHLDLISELVKPHHLGLDSHQKLLAAMLKMRSGHRAIDDATLIAEFGGYDACRSVGGAAYVAGLTEGVHSIGEDSIRTYAEHIKKAWKARQVAYVGESLARATRADDQEIESAIANARARLNEIDSQETPTDPETTTRKRARVVCLADVAAKPVRWLWQPYIPTGMVSMISGDPGAGKSYVALAIAADVTKGVVRGGLGHEPGGVLYLTLENPLAEVMRPRLDSLGGDPSRFWVVNGTVYEDENGTDDRGIITFADLDLLDEIIQANSIRLVVIDPLTSFFGEGKNTNHSTDTRPVFDRLAKMAERHDLAVVVIRHNNKQQGGKAIYRGGGSIDMTGAVRCEMLAAISPENPEQRALAHIKTNIGPQGRTQGYVIEPDGLGGVRFSWTGELAVTAEELNAPPEAPENRTKQDDAREWLLELLHKGSQSVKNIEGLAKAGGHSWGTVRLAKQNCSAIKSRKVSMDSAADGWIWYLSEGGENRRLQI
jgi:hypothetical protein